MSGTAPEPAWRRPWAAEQLGVEPDATADAVRAAFLSRVADAGFTPPPAPRLALEIFTGRRPWHPECTGAEQPAIIEAEASLRATIESFAAKYWSLSLVERRQQWLKLWEACSWSGALRQRLRGLQAGLDVVPPTQDAPEIAELVQHVRELYVLTPTARGERRREILRAAGPLTWRRRRAARRFARRYPALAKLQVVLIARLSKPYKPRKIPTFVKPSKGARVANWTWLFILCASGLIRALTSSHQTEHPSAPPSRLGVPAAKWQPPGVAPSSPEIQDFWKGVSTGRPFGPRATARLQTPKSNGEDQPKKTPKVKSPTSTAPSSRRFP